MGIAEVEWEVQTGYKEKLLHHEDSPALEQATHRGYAVSVLEGFKIQLYKALWSDLVFDAY